MSTFKTLRERLGVTQSEIASAMGCTQGNISFYERGQTVPPDAARKLIVFAQSIGHALTFDDVYGGGMPDLKAPAKPNQAKVA